MVAITQDTTVQPGGIIHIHSDELPPGARAQVIVLVEPPTPVPHSFPTMRSLLGAAPEPHWSPKEIDDYLRTERRLMGKINVNALASRHLYFDSNILIYSIERHPDFVDVLDPLLALIDSAQAHASTSELTLAECLVKPFAENDLPRQQLFQNAITTKRSFDVVPVSRPILIAAAQLRALHKPRLPDAIHLATALASACQTFITNDQLIKPIPGITVLQLADLTP